MSGVLDKQKIIASHRRVLDGIRSHKKTEFTIESLKDDLALARSTVDKAVAELRSREMLSGIRKKLVINRDWALFLGVSIGSQHIRVHLLGLDFESVLCSDICSLEHLSGLKKLCGYSEQQSDDYGFAYMTPQGDENSFDEIKLLVSSIVAGFLNQANENWEKFPLVGIGFAVTGPVDYENKIWCSAPRLMAVTNLTLSDLMGYANYDMAGKLNLFLSIDNNAKASMVSEYQHLIEENGGLFFEDVAVLYVGSGIGAASVVDGRLLRGRNNESGEISHIQVCLPDPDNGNVRLKSIEPDLSDEESYVRYLPYIFNTINCVLSVNRIILIGHSVAKNDALISTLLDKRTQYTVASTQRYCKPEMGRKSPGTAAIGAAIEVYMSMCCYDEDKHGQDRVNLAQKIAWW